MPIEARCLILFAVCAAASVSRAQFESTATAEPAGVADGQGEELHFTPTETYRDVAETGDHRYSAVECAAPNPTKGPQEAYVYRNDRGVFKVPDLTSVNGGKAKYRWFDGSQHEDRLTYIAHGYVTEREGFLITPGTKVSVWAYRSEDSSGNHVFLYFGTDAVIDAPQGRRYPIYYSYGPPGPAPTWRIPTASGTTRD